MLSENLMQLAKQKSSRRNVLHWLLISLCAAIVVVAIILIGLDSPYLSWNMSNSKTALTGTVYHAFEWLFFRLAPLALAGAIVGIIVTRKKDVS